MALAINGELVPDEVFHQELIRLSGGATPEREQLVRLQRTAERNVVYRTLLQQMARQLRLSVSAAEIDSERRRQWGSANNTTCGAGIRNTLEQALLIEKLKVALARHLPRPSRAEVEQFYRSNPVHFSKPERTLVAHIIKNLDSFEDDTNAWLEMKKAEQELADGKPFANVAEHYSDCKGNGGSLGWIERGEMIEEFDAVVFHLKKSERSPIFRTLFGLHIAEVRDRKAAGVQAFEEVRTQLARRLYEERKQSVLDHALEKAMSQAQIVSIPSTSQHRGD